MKKKIIFTLLIAFLIVIALLSVYNYSTYKFYQIKSEGLTIEENVDTSLLILNETDIGLEKNSKFKKNNNFNTSTIRVFDSNKLDKGNEISLTLKNNFSKELFDMRINNITTSDEFYQRNINTIFNCKLFEEDLKYDFSNDKEIIILCIKDNLLINVTSYGSNFDENIEILKKQEIKIISSLD